MTQTNCIANLSTGENALYDLLVNAGAETEVALDAVMLFPDTSRFKRGENVLHKCFNVYANVEGMFTLSVAEHQERGSSDNYSALYAAMAVLKNTLPCADDCPELYAADVKTFCEFVEKHKD